MWAIAAAAVRTIVPDSLFRLAARIRERGSFFAVVITIVVTWFWVTFVRPLVDAILAAGALIIGAVQLIFLGSDGQVGTDGQLGLADILLFVVESVLAATAPAFDAVIGVLGEFNATIATVAADAGLAGPPIAAALWTLEVGVGLWLLWAVVRVVDIPGINLAPLLRVLSAPIRALRGVFS